jgi:hypothetical protein
MYGNAGGEKKRVFSAEKRDFPQKPVLFFRYQ